ncbi:HNH endonuclease signature motif containing protein [Chitinilyticum litopenaei]|uniref:HNH endonuclease signature motif containing protein n=1 Tax=Chitinilyticum litopenaei TaxID=1121276 RepID=UPI000685B046|nr:HNH endonuclease signature motif containing protein [Chitinilyticum litopenaei]
MATIESLLRKTTPAGDCQEWAGYIAKSGYGLVWHSGKTRQVHRVSYELHKGPITDGLHVMHICDNRKCINPGHLVLGTRADNMADMIAKKRDVKAKGVSHPNAKLSPEIAAEIRRRYIPYDRTNGSSALSREFGVSQGAVYACIRGVTWQPPVSAPLVGVTQLAYAPFVAVNPATGRGNPDLAKAHQRRTALFCRR